MLKISNRLSGLNRSILPTELIPLNLMQLSRGLLNYALIQSKINPFNDQGGWIYPYWIIKQYNPSDISFLPRAHSGLSLNLTHRNWTAFGNPFCPVEPIVDPRGLVTPYPNGWSVDTWLTVNEKIFFPSVSHACSQKLVDDLPVVETEFEFEGLSLLLISFTEKDLLVHQVSVKNFSGLIKSFGIVISARPFNPEGVGIINNISFDFNNNKLTINGNEELFFNEKPDIVHCSNFENGDAAEFLVKRDNGQMKLSSACRYGLASAAVVYNKTLDINESYTIRSSCCLKRSAKFLAAVNEISFSSSIKSWNNLLSEGSAVITPDKKLNSLIKASISSLLMLTDGESITPGPATYHQFWFRDAAFMISALDKFGFGRFTAPIIKSFPKHQTSSGYFRSQKGEWDSNGQVLWTAFNHYLIDRDKNLLTELFESLYAGVKWIDKSRLKSNQFLGKPFYGLLPKGISAEHLGHADYYFWDNFWSLAGIKSFIGICDVLGKESEKIHAEKLLSGYRNDVEKALEFSARKYSTNGIPASPSRNIDCGMIGSLCANYPLQLFPGNHEKILSSLDIIFEKFFYDGLFFQQFIHSGMNVYLTLHVAHSYLFSGNGEKFRQIFSSVLSKALPTLNYPEAIHPFTGGGIMGDGHHGWAAAEILSAVRDAFIFEDNASGETVLLQGIPSEWIESRTKFSLTDSQLSSGIISIFVETHEDKIILNIDFRNRIEINRESKWKIILPAAFEVKERSLPVNLLSRNGLKEVIIHPGSCTITLIKSKASRPVFPNQE